MPIYKLVNGNLDENTYVIGDNDKQSCYIIDPGEDPSQYLKIAKLFKEVKAILLTHGHFDHTSGVDKCVKEFNCPVYMNLFDVPHIDGTFIKNHQMPIELSNVVESTIIDCFKLEDNNIIVYETPGHSKGSVSYYFKNENALFVGDFIFFNGIGRTDLPGGNNKDMYQSLCFFKSLKDDIKVYSGHGKDTTVKEEKLNNPYILSI